VRASQSIYVSTSCIKTKESLRSRLSSYASQQMFSVELGACVSVVPDDLAEIVGREHVAFLIHNYFPPPEVPFFLNLASPSALIQERSIELVSQALHLSAKLGAPFYSLHAGFIVDPIGFGESSLLFPSAGGATAGRNALGRYVDALKALLPLADTLGIRILVENNSCTAEHVGKLLLQTTCEFEELFRQLPCSTLGLLLDTGHLNVAACTLGFDCLEFVERLHPHIGGWHLHTNSGYEDSHLPATREDWMLRLLKDMDWSDTPVVVEACFGNTEDLGLYVSWLSAELLGK
jgi:sugar phosphate isomerase/epimerase